LLSKNMALYQSGNWRLAGIRLPDFGVTERLGLGGGNANVINSGALAQPAFQNPAPAPYTPQPVTNVPTTSSTSTRGSVLGYNNMPSNPLNAQNAINSINNNTNTYDDLINQDYDNALRGLGEQAQGLEQQAGTAKAEIDNDFQGLMTGLGQSEGQAVAGQSAQLATAEKSSASATQQARDLFRQVQQQNVMQLSGLGISSSSVAEGLAERLGVETARRIAGISGSLQEIRTNVSKEIGNIKSVYSQRREQAEKTKVIETQKINQGLMAGLAQINAARDRASTDKARSRAELLTNAQTAINEVNQQTLAFQNSLQRIAQSRTELLQQYVTDPALIAQYQSGIARLNAQPGITQSYLGNYGVNQQGQFGYAPGSLKSVKRDDPYGEEEVDFTNPSAWR
jgi:hypothetical protein